MAASHSLKLSVFPHYAPPLRKNSKAFCEPKFGSVNISARWKLRPQSLKFWSQNKRLVCRSKSIVSAAVGEEEDENEEDESSFEEPEKVQTPEPERDFSGTPYIPVYVMLPLGIINQQCQLVDPESLQKYLTTLKFAHVDGVMVDCWWGIVEGEGPQKYNWSGYRELFDIVCKLKLKLQVVMSLHECGGNVGDDVSITLPNWILEIGEGNPDIFFTDREGRRNTECLTWGIDKERVLKGRTGLEVCFDYMRSFRMEFHDYFEDGLISEIEIGMGPCGELRYPSYPERHGWKYPGIGQFQDKQSKSYSTRWF